ncbi:hypothetical protein CYMTET_22626 [Cymbomonas tetramitiformis]|uniref:Uncharacterized protein n=1 Tax=Cymbomonas tetramitiformis TaxID=36881 RepID=A0AAE0G0Y1_9CHLO|nr:hypothetical protein CYMTET_22626 [Cymbomonas tetramitiformis]
MGRTHLDTRPRASSSGSDTQDSKVQRTDKLAMVKQAEREKRDALKMERELQKTKKKEEERNVASTHRELRQLDGGESRRARKDVKKEEQKERRKMNHHFAAECEHGVHRCRICNPPTSRKADHRAA